jgi:dTMP kinase
MTPGHFITFEGIDGAGKSTHIAPLAERLRAAGRTVLTTREPGGTPLAERLRELTLHAGMDALTEALLMFAARRDHIRAVIRPALAAGAVVLCDRFTDATFAYQGGGRGVAWDDLARLEQLVLTGDAGAPLQPALTRWFDLPPPTAAARLAGVRLPDRFEAQPVAFFEAVRAAYARRLREASGRIVRIDAGQSRKVVWDAVWTAVQKHMEREP